jgi:translation elongation factor EF-Ts
LVGKPEELQKRMIRGKMMKFLQEKAMDCQKVGFEESDLTIAEYLTAAEKRAGKIRITKAERFGL